LFTGRSPALRVSSRNGQCLLDKLSDMSDSHPGADLSRRSLLAALGLGGAAVAAGSFASSATADPLAGRSSTGSTRPSDDPVAVPPVSGVHLQFGADPTAEMTVSWHGTAPVAHPRVLLARTGHGYERQVRADVASYTDAKSGLVVYAQHGRVRKLDADTEYVYAAVHDGAAPQLGTFRTAPRGRTAFTFTSFGDQGTPTVGRRYVPPAGVTIASPPFVNDNLGSPAAGDTTAGVERVAPLLHLFNGDLCYANLADDRVRTWQDFWNNNTRSARNRPWMPCAGNHENELGNGPIGYRAYQTYFAVPHAADQDDVTRGLWYAFTVGSVRFISLNNDDICYQDGGSSYVRGYSDGAQKRWLEQELRRTRADDSIDWIVVCMHQVAISTANNFNGADLGVRQEWLPLFDKYGVDLVVCGHEHHYERTLPIRGQQDNVTRTPIPRATATDLVDTEVGTVHMIIGGGGTSAPSNQLLFDPPQCRVIVGVSDFDPAIGKRPPVYVYEPDAPWSATRDRAQAYGFASFEVDPGTATGGTTSISVTYYEVTGAYGQLDVFERFTLKRRRRDARH
jgi:hypothetical protein